MALAVFDIGGTKIKYGIGSSNGELAFDLAVPTEAHKGGKNIVHKIEVLTRSLQQKWDIDGIAISTAGTVDPEAGTIIYATDTIPGYTGLEVKGILESRLALPVELENDVHCSALGELWRGAASHENQLLFLTLGTGIGGSLVADGCIQRGASGLAGTIGHMNLYPNGKACSCGQSGCFEQYASTKSLDDKIKGMGIESSLPEFMELIKQEDHVSLRIFEEWLADLALGIQSLVYIWNPGLVVIGGGISAQGEWLEKTIKSKVFENLLMPFQKNLQIKVARNGNKSNMFGAMRNFQIQQSRRGDVNASQ